MGLWVPWFPIWLGSGWDGDAHGAKLYRTYNHARPHESEEDFWKASERSDGRICHMDAEKKATIFVSFATSAAPDQQSIPNWILHLIVAKMANRYHERKWLTKLIDAKPKVEHPSPWGDMNHVPPEVWGLCLDMSPQVCGRGLGQESKVAPCPPSGGMY